MASIYEINLLIYNLSLLPIIFLSTVLYFFALLSIAKNKEKFPKNKNFYPFVTIQIPVYNDPVIKRCIESCLKLDYPNYEILVLDDSTDDKTRKIIDKFSGKVKIVRRNNRKGFKAGALNAALPFSKGEIIVIFDSDWIVPKNFLKKIVAPFKNKKIAAVQAKQKFMGWKRNFISFWAALLQTTYYNIWLPLMDKVNATFCGGTLVAIRKKALLEIGGWNEKSLTEDADLTIKLLNLGYRIVYLEELYGRGEVPYKLKYFFSQYRRWSYGLTRSFIENWKTIIFGNLKLSQKFMISFVTLGHSFAIFVTIAFITGQVGWFIGPKQPLLLKDVIKFLLIFALTSGFLSTCFVTLYQEKKLSYLPKAILISLILGVPTAINNSIGFLKALFNAEKTWVRTPKIGNLITLRKVFGKTFPLFE